MRNKLLTLAGALALLAILGPFYAKPLLAQVRAALVKNIDEKGRIPYHADSSCTPTGSNVGCAALFPVVPANRRLVIEYVSAELAPDFSGGTPAAALVNTNTNAGYPLPVFLRFVNDFGLSSPVLIYVEAGQQVQVQALGRVTEAHITGYLVDLTQ